MAKRGRKPKNKNYFGQEQEQAVIDYLATDDALEKNRIFNTVLKPAFKIMIESIIRRYGLYTPNEEFQDTFDDALSFLMTKISSFNPEKNFKVYSYAGTIVKNFLIYKINQYNKNIQRNESYDNIASPSANSIIDNSRYSYQSENSHQQFLNELTGTTVSNIEHILAKQELLHLTENEIKVGNALLNLIKNWDDLFVQMGSNKFNKSSILLFIKENTLLNTKEIRDAMAIYKKRYYEIKNEIISG